MTVTKAYRTEPYGNLLGTPDTRRSGRKTRKARRALISVVPVLNCSRTAEIRLKMIFFLNYCKKN